MKEIAKILLVDDNPNNRLALRTVLKGIGAELREASNGLDALSMSMQEDYALILLDVQMPDMDGFEVCEQLRADPRTHNTPVIFLTAAYKEMADTMRGYVAGATDYLAKPIEDYILKAKVQVFLKLYEQKRLLEKNNEYLRVAATVFESREGMMVSDANNDILQVNRTFCNITGYETKEVVGKNPRMLSSGRHDKQFFTAMWEQINNTGTWGGEIWNRRKNGVIYPEFLTITAVKDPNGLVTNYVGTFEDITNRKSDEEEINNLAFYDPLTQLPNRRLLMDRLQQAIAATARSGHEGALLFIDLDNFKTLNDTLGHNYGDMLLQQVAQRLTICVREGDTVARLGGDEFVVMLVDLSGKLDAAAEQTKNIGAKILDSLNQPYMLANQEYRNSPSIGATLFSDNHQSLEDILKQADIAMYQSKKAGRNTLRFFEPQMQEAINTRAAMEMELHKALENRQFHLHYQIQVDNTRRPMGAEVLIRWMHPERGLVLPAEFIPLAETTGQIVSIGSWALQTACAQINEWQKNAATRNFVLAVNISAKQFMHADFASQVQAVVRQYGINPKLLKLELTESMLFENIELIIGTMSSLKKFGIQFSLDDFGTGYSSLQYLKLLPLDQLKIDQSFVRNIAIDGSDQTIVRTIISMANNLGLDIIAEGVETEEQQQILFGKGCNHYQGYLYGKPVPIKQFDGLLGL